MLFLEKLEQKKVYIILVILICILIGIMYAIFFMPEKIISQTSVMLMKTEAEENNTQNNGIVELSQNQMSTFEELIKSDSNLQEVKDNLKLNYEIESRDVSVKRISDSDTFQIKVTNINLDDSLSINSEITKLFENTVLSMYKNTRLYVVDEAHIISSSKISTIIVFATVALLVGILIDCAYIIVLMIIEKNVKNCKDIESNFSLKVLGLIPLRKINKNTELISSETEKTSTNREFKKLRSNIQFVNVNNNNKNIILITNCSGQEGKTYVSSNLAISYANVGKKVILIDCDLTSGNQAQLFNMPNNLGLSNFLSNLDETGIELNERINSFIKETNIKNLNVITSGTIPPNSSELLSSEKFSQMLKDLSVFYDVVILDGTVILNKIDSLILSRYATSSLIVSIPGKTRKDDLWKTKRDIQNVGGRIVGIVLNKVKIKEEKEEKVTYKVFVNLKERLKEFILNLKENKKQKLLNESNDVLNNNKELEEIHTLNIVEENINTENKEVASKDENIKPETEEDITQEKNEENPLDVKENIELSVKEENEIVTDNLLNNENIEENTNNISNSVNNNENINVLFTNKITDAKKIIRKLFKKLKIKSIKTYRKTKQFLKNKFNKKQSEENSNVENKEVAEKIEKVDTEVEKIKKESREIRKEKSDNSVLVIVDCNNEVCRAFSKNCFTEKLVRGLDTADGFIKAHYSSYLIRKRTEALMLMYTLNKKQVSRIDPLVYTTLNDYDEHVWIEQKVTSNKAESYVLIMAKDYTKNDGESKKNYMERCRNTRKKELENLEIEIEYNIDLLWKTSKMKFSDKIAMQKYAKIYGKTNVEEINDVQYEEEGYEKYEEEDMEKNLKNNDTLNNVNLLKKINPLRKIEKVKNSITNVEQVKIKTVKEIEEEVNSKLNEQNSYVQENIFDMSSNFSQVVVEEENEIYNQELQKQERKKEAEVLKKIQKEKNAKKKKEEKTRREKRREEKIRQREEQKRAKEMEREKKIEEARIEEELLGDNLYPKTKYNKNI